VIKFPENKDEPKRIPDEEFEDDDIGYDIMTKETKKKKGDK